MIQAQTVPAQTYNPVMAGSMKPEQQYKKAWDRVLARMRELVREGYTYEQIGRMMGASKASISQWLAGKKGGESVSAVNLIRYIRGLGLRLGDTLGDEAIDRDEYSFLPKVKARPRAGVGGLEVEGDTEGLFAFGNDFLRRYGNPANMVLMEVRGDSMHPTLRAGDQILVDKSATEPREGSLVVVRYLKEILIKRFHRTPHKVVLTSDNKAPEYRDIEIDPRDPATDFAIIGTVKWAGRSLNQI